MNWLDTEIKSILWKKPEPKLAPPKAGEFDLILFEEGTDFKRLVRAICRTTKYTKPKSGSSPNPILYVQRTNRCLLPASKAGINSPHRSNATKMRTKTTML